MFSEGAFTFLGDKQGMAIAAGNSTFGQQQLLKSVPPHVKKSKSKTSSFFNRITFHLAV